MTARYVPTREVAALVRRALRDAFPGVAFSVRCGRGTGSAWIAVEYTDGPLVADVEAITRRFQGEQFNGMTDMYDTLGTTLLAVPGAEMPEEVRFVCSGINVSRDFTPAAVAWTLAEVERVRLRYRMRWQDDDVQTLEMRHGDVLHFGPDDRAVPYYGGELADYARTAAHRFDFRAVDLEAAAR